MLKIFFVGILLGLAVAAGALHTIPAVDQIREVSIITVATNGGNSETYHINIPDDRIMVGASGRDSDVPKELVWPKDSVFRNIGTELFKIRNARNAVIGVASRTVAREGDTDLTDWLIHLPARGSMFINMEPRSQDGRPRIGRMRAGSREFSDLNGIIAESWVSDTSSEDGAPDGRIELIASYVSSSEPDQRPAEEQAE